MLSVELLKTLPDFTLELDFTVEDEVLVLFGPSGAGKTMTLRLIAGLEHPDAGEIRLNERVLFSADRRIDIPPRGRRCGFVFQDWALFPHLTVEQNVRYGLRERTEDTAARVRRLLATFRIGHLQRRYPAELSGGEKQRVALARALTTEPDVLLLDEPFSALDFGTREAVYEELRAAHELWRIPFVLVTHERREAERLGDRILFLHEGRQASRA